MAQKCKDKKGRVLRTGESQQHDLTYQYRFKNLQKRLQYVYAPTLEELRRREAAIQKDINNGIDYAAGKVTVVELHPDKSLPHITPHVFRHTFCTNMANAGMDVKMLQYLMGHSDMGVTLNVYTHSTYEQAAEQLMKVVQFRKSEQAERQVCVG